MPPEITSWEEIPKDLLVDCAQLVKANSIEGTKIEITFDLYCRFFGADYLLRMFLLFSTYRK